jgi:hypothetical protein
MNVVAGLLAAVALFVGVIGLGLSSQATVGASIVGFACLIGIVARIVQASRKP